jgi:probable HAF family extracellular repeat protein
MRRLALVGIVVSSLGLLAGDGSASSGGQWVLTDIGTQALREFPGYTGITFVTMTAGGRVLWTARPVASGRFDSEVFQWKHGTIRDLGPLPKGMVPRGWNSGGAIVGSSLDSADGPSHAYVWRPGKTTPLGSLGGASSAAFALNDHGQIVGTSQTAKGISHAFFWQNGKLIDISPGGTLYGVAGWINKRGQALAFGYSRNQRWYYLWERGKSTFIHVTDGSFAPLALNDRGEVIGLFQKRHPHEEHLILWRNGKTTDLGPNDYYAGAINDRGEVIFPRVHGGSSRAILWRDGTFTDLGNLGGPWTYPTAINDRGQVVGTSALAGSTAQAPRWGAFLWQNGKMLQLPSAVDMVSSQVQIDSSGRHIAAGTGLDACTRAACDGQVLYWTYEP